MTSISINRRSASAAAVLAAAALGAGLATTPAALARRGAPPAVPHLPADWPSSVRLPPGALQGSAGARGQWTAKLLVRGAAAPALRSTVRFYRAAGFRSTTAGRLRRGTLRLTIVTANRDHSATKSFVVIGVTRVAG